MLASITPLGERGRHNRWGVTAATYAGGLTLGGAGFGVALGAAGVLLAQVGQLSSFTTVVIIAALALMTMAFDLGLAGIRIPTVQRQVNEDWLGTYRGTVYGFGFGVQLGIGVATIVSTAAVYLAFTL